MGLLNIMQSVWLFIILFYVYGMETSFIKFFIDAKDVVEKKEIYSTSLILITLTSVIFSVVLLTAGSKLTFLFKFEDPAEANSLYNVLCYLLFFDALSRFPLLLLRAELKANSYLLLNFISVIINIVSNILLIVYFKAGILSIFYSYIISVLISFILGLVITKQYLQFSFNFIKAKALIKYGNKFIYIGVFLLLIDISDRFFLKYFCDEATVGIYSASYKLTSVMSLIIAAFKFSWTPYFLNISKDPENKSIISNIFTYFIFTGLLLFLIFAFFTEPIAKINIAGISILDSRYQPGLIIVPVILLSYLFSGIYAILNAVPFFKDKTSYLFIVSAIGVLVNFILNYLLIPKFTIMGAAYATLLTYLIMSIILFFITQNIYKIEYSLLKIFGLFITAFLIYFAKILVLDNFEINNIYLILLQFILVVLYLCIIQLTGILELKKVKLIFNRSS